MCLVDGVVNTMVGFLTKGKNVGGALQVPNLLVACWTVSSIRMTGYIEGITISSVPYPVFTARNPPPPPSQPVVLVLIFNRHHGSHIHIWKGFDLLIILNSSFAHAHARPSGSERRALRCRTRVFPSYNSYFSHTSSSALHFLLITPRQRIIKIQTIHYMLPQ